MSYHWVHFSCEDYLGLPSSSLPSLLYSKSSWDSSIVSDRKSLLKLFKSILLTHSVKSITHQDSACRKFILLYPKDTPPRLTVILVFNWHYSFMPINIQYSTSSCVSNPSSAKTLIRTVVKPRVPFSVHVKTLVGTGVDTCTVFVLTCEAPAPCFTVKTCGASVGISWSSADESAPDSDKTCKINKCKQN